MLFLKSAELSKTTYSIWGQSRKFNDIIYTSHFGRFQKIIFQVLNCWKVYLQYLIIFFCDKHKENRIIY